MLSEENGHACSQVGKINEIQKTISEIQDYNHRHDVDRNKRIEDRKKTDQEISDKLASISKQMTDLIELNNEVKDFKTAWRIGKNLGLGLTAIVAGLAILFGGVIAVKEWINH